MHDNGVTLPEKGHIRIWICPAGTGKTDGAIPVNPTLGYRPAGSKAGFETGRC